MRDISLVRILPVEPRVPFISARLVAGVISIIAVIISMTLFITKGLNYGLDFTGGVVTTVDFGVEPPADVQNFVQTRFEGSQVQNISQPAGSLIDHDYLRISLPLQIEEGGSDDASADGEAERQAQTDAQQVAQAALFEALEGQYDNLKLISTETVSGKVSGELRRKGLIAVVLALGLVLAYIWFRFEWQFGLGAVAALLHDVILTLGVFELFQIEFNLAIIAAILTIVGYSLNDTVIVYDRIRENLRKYKKMPLAEVINISINDTLSRTILTSMTTLLALTALYVLGGPGLEGFSFAMIWGVIVGTYSSIFVASPLLLVLKLKRGSRIDAPKDDVAKTV
ncbi:protein translocase subunit SecF [Algimonas porphyrae]|uniref:Protein-export membrane protein SecF n=1 Tax=Algimonas porphyrae TaxID=1128113 RepID=A0ABQ5UY57_9PROT|nr:protein translocase subunit SecF [Algimonas porphyrae]GLQ20239.1 protein-export membrane protein SecF [Algimonas porphyrae]